MSNNYRTRNQLLLAKVQSAVNVEATPAPGTDAVKARSPIDFVLNLASLETDYAQESVSQSPPITGGGNGTAALRCYLKGSGTGGTAPDNGVLLRGCGMSETLTAAAVTGTAQAGAASAITLAAGSSAVTDAYKGMVIRTTGGTGPNQTRAITAYNGTTKVATVTPAWTVQPDITTTYSIDANALYRPVTVSPEWLTLVGYQHRNVSAENSRRTRLLDAAGTFGVALRTKEMAEINFNFTGVIAAKPDDIAHPAAPTFQSSLPEPYVNALSYLGDGAVKFSNFSFDLAGDVQQSDDPAAAFGVDAALTVARKPGGVIVPNMDLMSSRDSYQDWISGTPRPLWLRWGSAAGKRVSLLLPSVRPVNVGQTDERGFGMDNIRYRSDEADGEIWICIH